MVGLFKLFKFMALSVAVTATLVMFVVGVSIIATPTVMHVNAAAFFMLVAGPLFAFFAFVDQDKDSKDSWPPEFVATVAIALSGLAGLAAIQNTLSAGLVQILGAIAGLLVLISIGSVFFSKGKAA